MIKTKRLYLRYFTEDDANALFDYLSIPEVVKYEPHDVLTREQAIEEAKFRSQHQCFFAVCLHDTNQLIGNIYFDQEKPDYLNTYQLGYVFHPDYQRKGYATEASLAILKYGFDQLKAHRIISKCNQLNVRSWKLMERIGMRREAATKKSNYFKYDEQKNPIWINSFQYAILEEEYFMNKEIKHET